MRVYFKNFPADITEQDMIGLFSQYGGVTTLSIFQDKATGQPFGAGIITLDSAEAAEAAIAALNGIEIEGQQVTVEPAKDKPPKQKPQKQKHQQRQLDPTWQLVAEIADALGEAEHQPRKAIHTLLTLKGVDFVQAVFEETFQIEEQGGMLTQDGSRRRTPGGVFFLLLKERMGKEFYRIFPQKNVRQSSANEPSEPG